MYMHTLYSVYDVNIKQMYNTYCECVYLHQTDRLAKNITKPVYLTTCHF